MAISTLRVMRGSQREAREPARDLCSDHHRRCYAPEEEAVAIELPWLSGAQASGGEREYGERVSGTWKTEVRRMLRGAGILSGG